MGSAAVHCSFLIFGNPVESKPVLGTRPPLEVDMLCHRLTFQATRQFEQVYLLCTSLCHTTFSSLNFDLDLFGHQCGKEHLVHLSIATAELRKVPSHEIMVGD